MSRLLLLGVCAAMGCASMSATWAPTPNGALPAVAPAKVRVIDFERDVLLNNVALPEGISLREVRPAVHAVELTPGFPTTAQPHRWIGELRISPSSLTYNMPKDALEQMVAEAAAHGANALVRLGPGHGVALRLSSAAPPHPPADQLMSQGLAALQGYRTTPVMTIRLERLEPNSHHGQVRARWVTAGCTRSKPARRSRTACKRAGTTPACRTAWAGADMRAVWARHRIAAPHRAFGRHA